MGTAEDWMEGSRKTKRQRVGEAGSTPCTKAHGADSPALASSPAPQPIKPTTATKKRTEGVLSWDDYFMSVAHLSAMRSKDPSTQVGACIVNSQNRIVGIGYNGFPAGCHDDELPWAREAANPLETKYMYVCHAEMNAILNRIANDTRGCRIYVDLFPCNECAKLIIQSGIQEVIFLSDKYHMVPAFVASRRLLDCAGVRYRQFKTDRKVTIDLSS